MSYNRNTIIDLGTDNGFEMLVGFVKEGSLPKLSLKTDLGMLIEKQACLDKSDFADSQNKMFCIASPEECYISARYIEKQASELDPEVIEKVTSACLVYNVEPPTIVEKVASEVTLADFLGVVEEDVPELAKYAGQTDYGTELDICLDARAAVLPEEIDNLTKIAHLKNDIEPVKLAGLIRLFDEFHGLDVPHIQDRLGSPEYAVFEKRASFMNVTLNGKSFPLEKLAQNQDAFENYGVDVDFDEDPTTIKLALERLPSTIQKAISKVII